MPLLLFSNCTKEQSKRPTKAIEVKFKIPSTISNIYRDGAIYKDSYLVWSNDTLYNRMLVCYDLVNQEKSWEYDFNGMANWGRTMVVYEDVLVVDRDDAGLIIFDLNEMEIVLDYRYYGATYSGSSTPATFFGGKVYKGLRDLNTGQAKIISFDVETGAMKTEYEWDLSLNSKKSLTSPLVYYNENTQEVNLTMVLQLSNFNSDSIKYAETYLINVNEDYSLNWMDTIKIQTKGSAISNNPIIVGNDILLGYNELTISYNKNTGKRNWTKTSGSNGSLINIGDEVYARGQRLAKLDKTDGHIIWNQTVGSGPSVSGDFEVVNNSVIYVPISLGYVTVLDNQNGAFIPVDEQNEIRIANPKFYKEQDVLITHNANEVIGFIIK